MNVVGLRIASGQTAVVRGDAGNLRLTRTSALYRGEHIVDLAHLVSIIIERPGHICSCLAEGIVFSLSSLLFGVVLGMAKLDAGRKVGEQVPVTQATRGLVIFSL